jgi:hypothetical protein
MGYASYGVSVVCSNGAQWFREFSDYLSAAGYREKARKSDRTVSARLYGWNGNKDFSEIDARI